ncbi:CPBP family intramembrane metalloprotease [Bacillus sp. FJAT-42376]|nr:CPBP family intramembrane metalloprotease [Bacillus sp. FJAT-42376]
MEWSLRDCMALLFLAFGLVPLLIEFLLQDFLYAWLQNQLYSGMLTGLVMAGVFILGVYDVIALKPYRLTWDAVGLNRFSGRYWIWIFLWIILLIGSSLIILSLMEWMHIGWENGKTKSLENSRSIFSFFIAFLSAAVISPIYEEIFYRGFLYKWFRVKWGIGAGILLSSAVFTLVHIPTYNGLPVNFLSGIIFAWSYEKTKSIIPGMIIHGTFNGLAITLSYFS